ncbi:hypothetical protein, partial [Iamia sp.]|uniref:hypothetical protein n=1 Tax=Iamia sp. TaxID=2722710 RepID=UPI002C7F4FE5
NEVRVGHQRIGGRWTVSTAHAEVRWDGTRWSTLNVSARPGLLHVYEPGYEDVPLEPGRPWVPVRHRWAYAVGRPDHRFHLVCATDDHRGPGIGAPAAQTDDDGDSGGDDSREAGADAEGTQSDAVEDPTMSLDDVVVLRLTPLEHDVLRAYYSDFAVLPRPPVLVPRAHDEAARRLGRSRDSTRKAIERVNEKIARVDDAPTIASGRNVSTEIGRWLTRAGILDPT